MHTRRPANGWFGRVDTGNASGFGQQSVCATTEYACVGGAAALAPPRLWLCLGKLMQSNDAARNSRIAERAVMPAGEPVRCTGGASCLVIGWACAAMLRRQTWRMVPDGGVRRRWLQGLRRAPAPERQPQRARSGGSDYVARLPSCEESEVREIVWVAAQSGVHHLECWSESRCTHEGLQMDGLVA